MHITIHNLRVTFGMFVAVVVGMKETRSSVLLTRLARKLRKETGDNRYRARIEDERASLRSLIFISCTRPLRELHSPPGLKSNRLTSFLDLLFTEPVVSAFSVSHQIIKTIISSSLTLA